MRPFTPRKRSSTRPTTNRHDDQALREILAGPDDAHRRELETMLEDCAGDTVPAGPGITADTAAAARK